MARAGGINGDDDDDDDDERWKGRELRELMNSLLREVLFAFVPPPVLLFSSSEWSWL